MRIIRNSGACDLGRWVCRSPQAVLYNEDRRWQTVHKLTEVYVPLYDYQCDQCGHRFEVRQGIKEDPLTECPQCQGLIRRVIHPVGIVFKGSGFYITDYRSDKYKEAARKESAPAGSGDGAAKPAAGGDSKPASKPSGTKAAKPAAAKT